MTTLTVVITSILLVSIITGFVIFILCARSAFDSDVYDEDSEYYEEVEVSPKEIMGVIHRRKTLNGKFFIFDPADEEKTFVDESDSTYEDANGRLWRIKSGESQ